MTIAVLIALFVLPLLWSAGVMGLRRISHADDHPDDRAEKRYLFILLAPVLLGPVAMVVAQWLPLPVHPAAMVTAANPTVGQGPSLWYQLTPWIVPACLVVYSLGLAIKAIPLSAQFLSLHRIVNRALPSEIAPDVRLTEAAVPPLSWGRGIVLLPQDLIARLPQTQVELLIAHERAHISRGDVRFYAVLSWIDAIFWFNPFLRHQTALCRLAAELACDAAVTRTAPEMRETYATCLLMALKHAAGDARQCAPAVFSPSNSGEFKMRMTEIMRKTNAPRKSRLWAQVVMALLVLPLAGVQYAWSQDNAAKPAKPGEAHCPGGDKGPCTASADKWQVDKSTGIITLSGHVELKNNGRTYRADSAQFDPKTGDTKLTGESITVEAPDLDADTLKREMMKQSAISEKTRPERGSFSMQDAPLGLTSQVIAMKASADTRDITVTGRPLTDADRPADAGGNAITVTGKKLPDSSDNAITVTGHPTRSTDNAITVTGHPTQSTGNAITVTGRPLNSTDTRQTQ